MANIEYKLITALIGILGGLALIIGSCSKKATAASWAKKALFFVGLTAFAKGLLNGVKVYYSTTLTSRQLYLIDHYGAWLGGVFVGILLTLFGAGEMKLTKWGKNEAKTKPN